jgi:stage V sporulation protein G
MKKDSVIAVSLGDLKLKITEIKTTIVNEDKLKAFVRIIIDHQFMVRGIRIIKGELGLFVAMPSKRHANGVFQDIAHPINPETRNQMESAILDAYSRQLNVYHFKELSVGKGY